METDSPSQGKVKYLVNTTNPSFIKNGKHKVHFIIHIAAHVLSRLPSGGSAVYNAVVTHLESKGCQEWLRNLLLPHGTTQTQFYSLHASVCKALPPFRLVIQSSSVIYLLLLQIVCRYVRAGGAHL